MRLGTRYSFSFRNELLSYFKEGSGNQNIFPIQDINVILDLWGLFDSIFIKTCNILQYLNFRAKSSISLPHNTTSFKYIIRNIHRMSNPVSDKAKNTYDFRYWLRDVFLLIC